MQISAISKFLMTCVAVVILSGCTATADPVSPSSSPVATVTVTTAPDTTDAVTAPNDQLGSWTDYKKDDYLTAIAGPMGLQSLYQVKRRIVGQQFGDTYAFVGTYGVSCMVAISYDKKYAGKSIIHIPEQNVTILSRYNPVTFWLYRANVKIADTKSLLASQADNCR